MSLSNSKKLKAEQRKKIIEIWTENYCVNQEMAVKLMSFLESLQEEDLIKYSENLKLIEYTTVVVSLDRYNKKIKYMFDLKDFNFSLNKVENLIKHILKDMKKKKNKNNAFIKLYNKYN